MSKVYRVHQLPLFVFTLVCLRCTIEKPVTDFYRNARRPSGYDAYCQDCMHLAYSKSKDLSKRRPKVVGPVTSHVCPQCHIEKPLSEFYKSSTEKRGFRSACKDCMDARDTRRKRPGRRRESRNKIVALGYKWCSTCRSEKPITSFTTDKTKPDGRYTRCNDCTNTYMQHYVEEHYEIISVQKNAHQKRWAKAHPLQRQEICVRRRARQKAAAVDKVSYKRILERDGYWCYICEAPIDPHATGPGKLSFDHVKPLAGKGERKGTHSEDNIKPAHKTCNSRKNAKLLEEMTPFQRRGVA